jgi:hypothetical protein
MDWPMGFLGIGLSDEMAARNFPVSKRERSRYCEAVDGGWTDIVVGATAGDHAVQIYRSDDELVEFVSAYAVAGVEAGEPALLVTTAEHAALFREAIADHGWDTDKAEAGGLLAIADADATLDSLLENGRLSRARFDEVAGVAVDSMAARSGRTVRAFGEMVDRLCKRGDPQGALALEELWNDLARTRRFALICSYALDIFDREAQVSPIPSVCQAHSHVLPAWDVQQLTAAVDYALESVLGAEQSQKVRALIRNDPRRRRLPIAQLALMWMSSHMPVLADRMLAIARERYEAEAVAA